MQTRLPWRQSRLKDVDSCHARCWMMIRHPVRAKLVLCVVLWSGPGRVSRQLCGWLPSTCFLWHLPHFGGACGPWTACTLRAWMLDLSELMQKARLSIAYPLQLGRCWPVVAEMVRRLTVGSLISWPQRPWWQDWWVEQRPRSGLTVSSWLEYSFSVLAHAGPDTFYRSWLLVHSLRMQVAGPSSKFPIGATWWEPRQIPRRCCHGQIWWGMLGGTDMGHYMSMDLHEFYHINCWRYDLLIESAVTLIFQKRRIWRNLKNAKSTPTTQRECWIHV